MTSLVSFTDLPFELICLIFESALAIHRQSALCLLRLSSSLFTFLIPILYRTIVVRRLPQLQRLQTTLSYRHPRRETYINALRNLYVGPNLHPLPAEEFPNVESAMVKLYKPSFRQGLPMPYFYRLKYLTLHTFEDIPFLANIPFQTVTHLFIASNRGLYRMSNAIFRHDRLPHLTHLVSHILISTQYEDVANELCNYFDWLDGFEMLKVVGLAVVSLPARMGPHVEPTELEAMLKRNVHPGTVLLKPRFRRNVWEAWCKGEENIWDMAEKVLKEQNKDIAITTSSSC